MCLRNASKLLKFAGMIQISTIRGTFEPKTHHDHAYNPIQEVPTCDLEGPKMVRNLFGHQFGQHGDWTSWQNMKNAKVRLKKKTAAEKRQLRQWPRQKAIPLTLVIRIFWKNLSDYDLRKMFYNHAVTSISSCGSDEGHLLAYWIVNYFFKNRRGKIWIGWKSFTN